MSSDATSKRVQGIRSLVVVHRTLSLRLGVATAAAAVAEETASARSVVILT